MSEVMRYGHISYLVEATPEIVRLYPAMTIYTLATDFDAEHALRLEAERQVGELREQLAKHNDIIDKAWNGGHGLKGEFIPGALDAWKRPVKQHLPYDFSGNPSASAIQYCNGWNDAGGYWKNHAEELQASLDTAMGLLHEYVEWFDDGDGRSLQEFELFQRVSAFLNTTSTEGKDHE